MYMAEYMAGFLQYLQYMNTRGQGSQGDYQKHLATTSAAVFLLLLCTHNRGQSLQGHLCKIGIVCGNCGGRGLLLCFELGRQS